MPTKKPRERDEDGKFVSEKAVVSRVGEYEENPVPKKSGRCRYWTWQYNSL